MDSVEIKAYKCSKCGRVYMFLTDADNCCKPKICEDCGKEFTRNSYYTVCDYCREKREIQKEKERKDIW